MGLAGVVPFEENPHEINPECGYIVTANNRVAPRDYAYELGKVFELPERYNRISELLEQAIAKGQKLSAADLAAMQNDHHASWALRLRDAMTEVAGSIEALGRGALLPEAKELWRTWLGDTSVDLAGAALVYVAVHKLGELLIREVVGPLNLNASQDDAVLAYLEMGSFMGAE